MSERDWRIFREDMNIVIKGGRCPFPMRAWNESVIPPILNETICKLNFKIPTPIQM